MCPSSKEVAGLLAAAVSVPPIGIGTFVVVLNCVRPNWGLLDAVCQGCRGATFGESLGNMSFRDLSRCASPLSVPALLKRKGLHSRPLFAGDCTICHSILLMLTNVEASRRSRLSPLCHATIFVRLGFHIWLPYCSSRVP